MKAPAISLKSIAISLSFDYWCKGNEMAIDCSIFSVLFCAD